MKQVILACLGGIILCLSTTPADARRGDGGWSEELQFVTTTDIAGLSLCHLVKRRTVIGIPLNTSSLGYTLAANKCDADAYWDFTAQEMVIAQANGLIDPAIPTTPAISTAQALGNRRIYGLGGVGIGVLIFLCAKLRASKHWGRRKTNAPSSLHFAILDAMCKTAKANGVIDPGEVVTIQNVYAKLTGKTLRGEEITSVLENIPAAINVAELESAGKALSGSERLMVVKASLMVAVSDGEIRQPEHITVVSLARALKVSGDEFRAMLAQMVAAQSAAA